MGWADIEGSNCQSQTTRTRPVLLVTGFGPFPGVPFNVSAPLVEYLASEAEGIPAELHTAILPTHWRDGPAIVASKIRELGPDAVLHFGVSRHASGFQFETIAYNQCANIVDCAGMPAQGFYFRRGGPPSMRSTLPISDLAFRLRLAGLPAYASRDAGRYLCNATLYNSLHEAQLTSKKRAPLVGFIHIPALSAASLHDEQTDFGWREMQRGAVEILRRLAATLRASKHTSGRQSPNRINTGSI